jgi:CheY-like chemotaxis protein
MAKVLVVDPDDDFRESVLLVLERARHEALAFREAGEALPLVAAGVRVLVDDELPDVSDALAQAGAHVIALRKPMGVPELLAALGD